MIRRLVISSFLLIFGAAAPGQPPGETPHEPKHEVRAVWLTTVNSLDWPGSTDPDEQRESLRGIVENLKAANFNTIYFQVRSRADAFYRSEYEPWASQLTGSFGKDPGWDPLEFLIETAHGRQMEVHAWFNTYIAWTKKEPPPRTKPLHIFYQHPEWLQQVAGEWWFDPGNPASTEYLVKVAIDLAVRYDLDGIQFDFLRYPNRPFPDDALFRSGGNGLKRDEWRRDNVNRFVKSYHDSLSRLKPWVKIGAAPIGIYKNFSGARGQQSYSELYQDSRRWIAEGWMDYLVPQIYWTLGTTRGDPDFAIVAREWGENSYGRDIYAGIGAYKEDVFDQMPALIDSTRSAGLRGNSYFRYQNIREALSFGVKYRYPALIPPMIWKDSTLPPEPGNVLVTNVTDGIFRISWNQQQSGAAHLVGEQVKQFNVYRSATRDIDTGNPENIVAAVPAWATGYCDTIRHISSPKYFYGVTSIDRGNNESEVASESVVIPEIVELSSEFKPRSYVKMIMGGGGKDEIFFEYELADSLPVILKILDRNNKELLTLVDLYQGAGRYLAGADLSDLGKGEYTYLFMGGESIVKKSFHHQD